MPFAAEFGVDPLVVRLGRLEKTLDERAVEFEETPRIGVPGVGPLRNKTKPRLWTIPEKASVFQTRPIIGHKIGVKISPSFGCPFQ